MSDKFETLLATHAEHIKKLSVEELTDGTLDLLVRDALTQAKCLGAGDERENAALLCAASAKHWRDQDVLHDKANFRAFACEAEHRRDQIRSGERAVGFADAPEVAPVEQWRCKTCGKTLGVDYPDACPDHPTETAYKITRRPKPETAEAFNDFHAAALKPDAEVRGDTPVPTLYCWCGHDLSEHYEDQGCLAAHCYCSSFEERPKDDAPKPSTAPLGNASDTAKVIWEGQTAPPSDETPYISTKVQRPPVAVWIEIPDEFGISIKRIQMAAHQWFDEWGSLMFDGDPDHYSHWRLADQPKADEPVETRMPLFLHSDCAAVCQFEGMVDSHNARVAERDEAMKMCKGWQREATNSYDKYREVKAERDTAYRQRDDLIRQRDELRAQLAQANAEKVAAMGEATKAQDELRYCARDRDAWKGQYYQMRSALNEKEEVGYALATEARELAEKLKVVFPVPF